MLELAESLLGVLDRGGRLAVATVVGIDGSAPRALGTSMAVDENGRVIGSISGGCVEGAVYQVCERVLETGQPELCEFGYSDDDAFAVGLACGGRLTVAVQELAPGASGRNAISSELVAELERARGGATAGLAVVFVGGGLENVPAHSDPRGADAAADDLRRVRAELLAAVQRGRTVRRRIDCGDHAVDAALLVAARQPRLIVFGAVDFSVALSNAAVLLGYRVTVCDARPVFATPERFPGAEVVNRWPTDYLRETEVDERTAVCILTHDDKFDVPLIEMALGLPVAYVGAMGSRATHERRVAALRSRGVDDAALGSLHSPIGLDLGAGSPEETALSILAEIVATRTGASGAPLRETRGAIHRAVAEPSDSTRDETAPTLMP